MEDIDVFDEFWVSELLCSLAEEASELSQAALKFRRAIKRKNPTPKTIDECSYGLLEAIAGCELIIELLGYMEPSMVEIRKDIKKRKEERWKQIIRDSRK